MSKSMLIDASHPEETRVVVVNDRQLEEFDFESSTKKQLKGGMRKLDESPTTRR
jgi:ribonuclease E